MSSSVNFVSSAKTAKEVMLVTKNKTNGRKISSSVQVAIKSETEKSIAQYVNVSGLLLNQNAKTQKRTKRMLIWNWIP